MTLYVKNPKAITFLRAISSLVLLLSIAMTSVGIWLFVIEFDSIVFILGLIFFPISFIALLGTGRMRIKEEDV